MKIALLTLLLALTPTIVISEENTARARTVEYKHLNEKIESLEKAIRLQTLTTEAVRKENYDLACKAQKEATIATKQANVVDVNGYSDKQYAEICAIFCAGISERRHFICIIEKLVKSFHTGTCGGFCWRL